MPDFDPLEPFENKELLRNVLDRLEQFDYKLYGRIPLKFHRGEPTRYEFDLNLGVVHITEQDCQGLSEIFASETWRFGASIRANPNRRWTPLGFWHTVIYATNRWCASGRRERWRGLLRRRVWGGNWS